MWKEILVQKDINDLMEFFCGFHDSCITDLTYHNGTFVDKDDCMCFGRLEDCDVSVLFHSQCAQNIELFFTGVRKIHIVGVQDNYVNVILDSTLAFYDDILPSKYHINAKRSIVWADYDGFSTQDINEGLAEPDNTYIVATSLKWRVAEQAQH